MTDLEVDTIQLGLSFSCPLLIYYGEAALCKC